MNFQNDLVEFEQYLSFYENRSKNTIQTYITSINQFKRYLDTKSLNYLYFKNIVEEDYIQELYKQNLLIQTINIKIYALRKFYSYLYLLNKIDKEHFKLIKSKIIKKDAKPKNFLIIKDSEFIIMKKLIKLNSSNKMYLRNKLCIYFLYYTGIRVSELTNIKLKDFDSNLEKLTVIGKGNKENILYLNLKIQNLLKTYMKQSHVKKYLKETNNYLILNSRNEQLSRQGINLLIRKLFFSKYKNITPHSFRYSYAMTVYEHTSNVDLAKQLLKHSDSSTTKIYLDVNIQELKEKILLTNKQIERKYSWLKI